MKFFPHVLFGNISHFKTAGNFFKAQKKELIQKLSHTLKKGGLIFICDFFINTDEADMNRYRIYREKYGAENLGLFETDDAIAFRHQSPQWILELTKDFQKIELKKIKCKTLTGRDINGFYYFGQS